LHAPKKKTSRQLSKSRFSTLFGTNLRLLFHERVFFFASLSTFCLVTSAVLFLPVASLFRRKGPQSTSAAASVLSREDKFLRRQLSLSLQFCVFATFSGSFFVLCRHSISEIITFYFVNPPPVIIVCVVS
jgi:hypothetical protein